MSEAIKAKSLKQNFPDPLAVYQARNLAPDMEKMMAILKAM